MTLTVAPLSTLKVTSPYGERDLDLDDTDIFDEIGDLFEDDDFHRGVDLEAADGAPVFAMGNGHVRAAGAGVGGSAGGNAIDIVDDDDGRYVYLHLSSIEPSVRAGARVVAGQLVGHAGHTGRVTGPHLHLQWQPNFPNGATADPFPRIRNLRRPTGGGGGGAGVILLLLAGGYALTRKKRGRR